jgi:hypothetical protein
VASERQRIWRIIRRYQEEKNVEEYEMPDVVQYAVDRGYKLPAPISGIEQLTRKFTQAAAEEMRIDDVTRKPYRAHHARMTMRDGKQIPLWFDMDRAGRPVVQGYATQRREHIVGEVWQLTLDLEHWSRVHPNEDPVTVPPDMTMDIELKRNVPDDEEQEAG